MQNLTKKIKLADFFLLVPVFFLLVPVLFFLVPVSGQSILKQRLPTVFKSFIFTKAVHIITTFQYDNYHVQVRLGFAVRVCTFRRNNNKK